MTFNDESIWGYLALRQQGPLGSFRSQIERVPGINGYRVYKLGIDKVQWVCSGRIVAFNYAELEQLLWSGTSYVLSGDLYVFQSLGGAAYENCRLLSYQPIAQVEAHSLPGGSAGVSVRVQGVVEWCTPTV